MSDRLREALDFYENRRPRALNNWEALDILADAARRFLALTETGPDYEAAARAYVEWDGWIGEGEPEVDERDRKAAITVDAAVPWLSDYTEEET